MNFPFSKVETTYSQTTETDLLDWLSRSSSFPKVYWEQEGVQIAATGATLSFTDLPPFLPSFPLCLWGGHSFFPSPKAPTLWEDFPSSYFFLPEQQLIRQEQKTSLTTHFLKEKSLPSDVAKNRKKAPLSSKERESISKEKWALLIAKAKECFSDSPLKKVVLARSSTYYNPQSINPFSLLRSYRDSFFSPNLTLFLFQPFREKTFLGASPEKLYTRVGSHVTSVALAATRPLGSTKEEELRWKQELLFDRKEQEEFAFVKTSLLEALSPLCEEIAFSPEGLSILKTATLQHLYQPLFAKIKPHIQDQKLLSTLHPTAALGGFPKKEALSFLNQYEETERGWYGAPFGYCSAEKAEFIVGIRSLLVDFNLAHLFVGAGIVERSDPDKEWNELENKAAPWVKKLHEYSDGQCFLCPSSH